MERSSRPPSTEGMDCPFFLPTSPLNTSFYVHHIQLCIADWHHIQPCNGPCWLLPLRGFPHSKKSPDYLYVRLLDFLHCQDSTTNWKILAWACTLINPYVCNHKNNGTFHCIINHPQNQYSACVPSAARRHLHFITSHFSATDLFYRCLFAIHLH